MKDELQSEMNICKNMHTYETANEYNVFLSILGCNCKVDCYSEQPCKLSFKYNDREVELLLLV